MCEGPGTEVPGPWGPQPETLARPFSMWPMSRRRKPPGAVTSTSYQPCASAAEWTTVRVLPGFTVTVRVQSARSSSSTYPSGRTVKETAAGPVFRTVRCRSRSWWSTRVASSAPPVAGPSNSRRKPLGPVIVKR
ncbi:hypothetical protein STANM309S_02643 [Streptomyces tanashiensis]